MPISIYPPILKSTLSAFLATSPTYTIQFSLLSVTSLNDIGHVLIRVVQLSNNKSIVNTDRFPDGVIYKATPSSTSINIEGNDISGWRAGQMYKILMRFGTSKDLSWLNKLDNFATWKQLQINQDAFSEWSTVMVIKAIAEPNVYIKNAEALKEGVILTENTEISLTPLFTGVYEDKKRIEAIDKYKFDLLDEDGEEIDSSGWMLHINSNIDDDGNPYDTFRFERVLTDGVRYIVRYSIITVNGYTKTASDYNFVVTLTYLSELTGIAFRVESNTPYCRENGCINLYCTSTELMNGNYVITRASEKTNFTIWEDLVFLAYSNKIVENVLIHQDFTVESGIKYKYAIQQLNKADLRTSPTYDINNSAYSVDFEYSYLYRNGVQLRFLFNQTLSSFKHTTLRAKQDTLGDRYPHLVQNGNAYYAEFPISGLISFHMDEDLTFFIKKEDGYYYNDKLVIPRDKLSEDEMIIDTNLISDNIFVERIFREKVEEYLNDFNYKLYKSPTEGNIVVGLLNVSLTPNATVGRMLYSFSATAYEVLENTLENLNTYHIIEIGEFTSLADREATSASFGQVRGFYKYELKDAFGNTITGQSNKEEGLDIYEAIRRQEEISVGGGYKMVLENVTSIWVEQYPVMDFKAEILELEAQRAAALEEGEDTAEIEKEIKEYLGLERALNEYPIANIVELDIGGKNTIRIAPNKIYNLKQPITTLKLISSVVPIIVNYVCTMYQDEDTSVGVVSSVDTSRIWGLISGIFTGTDSVLKNYNYNYKSSETYRIYSQELIKKIANQSFESEQARQEAWTIDDTNFNVYKDINILDIIKQETLKLIEYIYNTTFNIVNGEITDGTYYYTFNQLTGFDIEADEGTMLLIGNLEDGSNAKRIRIGPSCRYVLTPLAGEVKYIALQEPQFCVINYRCLTNQMKKVLIGG